MKESCVRLQIIRCRQQLGHPDFDTIAKVTAVPTAVLTPMLFGPTIQVFLSIVPGFHGTDSLTALGYHVGWNDKLFRGVCGTNAAAQQLSFPTIALGGLGRRCRTAIHGTVHGLEKDKVFGSGRFVGTGLSRVIHALTGVTVIKVFIRVGQAKTVSNLVAHGVLSLLVTTIGQIKFVHFGTAFDNFFIHEGDNVDALPAGIAVVAVAHLHFPPNGSTIRIHLVRHGERERQGIGRPGVPFGHGRLQVSVPIAVEGIDEFQGQTTASVGPHPPVGVFRCTGIVGIFESKVFQVRNKVAGVKVGGIPTFGQQVFGGIGIGIKVDGEKNGQSNENGAREERGTTGTSTAAAASS